MVLNSLENIIIEFVCSDQFEIEMNNLQTVFEIMRQLEYKLMTYMEMYHKLIEQNPISEPSDEEILSPSMRCKYQVQADFVKLA